jgi:enoyl-CoA hydratase
MPYITTEELDDGVHVATFDNPPLNYFVAEAIAEFQALIVTWDDPRVKAVVFCGVRGRFIPSLPLDYLLTVAKDRQALPVVAPQRFRGFHRMIEGLRLLPKPVIFALTGDTMGAGLELSLGADIRVAEAGDYRIGPIESRIGAVPAGGGTQNLSRIIGPAAALYMTLRGLIVTPEEALQRGLVHEVVPDAKARAIELARDLASLPPASVAGIKRAIYRGHDMPLAQGLLLESESSLAALQSDATLARIEEVVAIPAEQRRDYFEPKV